MRPRRRVKGVSALPGRRSSLRLADLPTLSEVRADARRAFAAGSPCTPPYPPSWQMRCEVWVEEYMDEEAAAANAMTCGEPCAFDGQTCGLDPGHLGECLPKEER